MCKNLKYALYRTIHIEVGDDGEPRTLTDMQVFNDRKFAEVKACDERHKIAEAMKRNADLDYDGTADDILMLGGIIVNASTIVAAEINVDPIATPYCAECENRNESEDDGRDTADTEINIPGAVAVPDDD